jgi:hypothetical protein
MHIMLEFVTVFFFLPASDSVQRSCSASFPLHPWWSPRVRRPGELSTIDKGQLSMIFKYFFAWFGMMVLAIINGGLRDFAYKAYFGDLAAH